MMTIFSLGKAALCAAAVFSFLACSANPGAPAVETKTIETKTADMKPVNTGYQKPGAAVEFSTNFDGRADPGETEVFQVSVREFYSGGTMQINISGSEGLDVRTDAANRALNMSGDETHVFEVSVLAQTPGAYVLNLQALVTDENGNTSMRTTGIRIPVGDQSKLPKAEPNPNAVKTPSGETLIIMDAEETIQ